jgi:plasmid maintenance system antidote protein VapI
MYLKTLNLTFTKFAQSIDANVRNLKDCLSGNRRFSAELALKFSHFFHTSSDLWMKVYIKNQLLYLERDRKKLYRYRKYNYEKVLAIV